MACLSATVCITIYERKTPQTAALCFFCDYTVMLKQHKKPGHKVLLWTQ